MWLLGYTRAEVRAPYPCVVQESKTQKAESAKNSKVGVKISLGQPHPEGSVSIIGLWCGHRACGYIQGLKSQHRRERKERLQGVGIQTPDPWSVPWEPQSAPASEVPAPALAPPSLP